MKPKPHLKRFIIWILVFVISCGIIVLLEYHCSEKIKDWKLEEVFTGLAFVATTVMLVVQSTIIVQQQSENTFFLMIGQLREIADNIEFGQNWYRGKNVFKDYYNRIKQYESINRNRSTYKFDVEDKEKNEFENLKSTVLNGSKKKGREKKLLKKELKSLQREKEDVVKQALENLKGLQVENPKNMNGYFKQLLIKRIIRVRSFKQEKDYELFNSYFNYLYQILFFIDRMPFWISKTEKKNYAEILKSNLSIYELLMLFYHISCANDFSDKKIVEYKKLVKKYGILKGFFTAKNANEWFIFETDIFEIETLTTSHKWFSK